MPSPAVQIKSFKISFAQVGKVATERMRIEGFIWLENIVEKLLQKHSVEQREVAELFANTPHIRFAEKGKRKGEDLYAAFGQTDPGRYLIVYFIYKKGGQALVVSGRDMSESERKLYEREKK